MADVSDERAVRMECLQMAVHSTSAYPATPAEVLQRAREFHAFVSGDGPSVVDPVDIANRALRHVA